VSFAVSMRRHERRRHEGIYLDTAAALGPSTMPPGWRAEDVLAGGTRGFLTLARAAEAMNASETDIEQLARRGLLLAELVGSTLYVQPAIVSLTRVVHRREDEPWR
jgi:hypothetical protein